MHLRANWRFIIATSVRTGFTQSFVPSTRNPTAAMKSKRVPSQMLMVASAITLALAIPAMDTMADRDPGTEMQSRYEVLKVAF